MPLPPLPSPSQVDRELIRRGGLARFCRLAWPLVEPGPCLWNWHHDAICQALEQVATGGIQNLMVTVPPGCTKTTIVSKLFPAWLWGLDPAEKVLTASYDQSLMQAVAGRDTGTMAVCLSRWYRGIYPHVQIVGEHTAAEGDYRTTAKGIRYSTSTGRGRVTGRHGTIKIIDDPNKPSEIDGAAIATVNEWYDSTWSTRNAHSEKGVREVVIMQRLAERDLIGHIHDRHPGRFVELKLPMCYRGEPLAVGRDPRVDHGELLWPARYDAAAVATLRLGLGERASAQLEQDPTPSGGLLIKEEWLTPYGEKSLPVAFDRVFLSADLTFKKTEGTDRVAITAWGQLDHRLYLLWGMAERMSFSETLSMLDGLISTWSPEAVIVEDTANGPAVIECLRSKFPGIVPVPARDSKVARVHAITGYLMGGTVQFPPDEIPWWGVNRECAKVELLGFPRKKHDDFVDSISQAIIWAYSGGRSSMDLVRELTGWDAFLGR